MAYSHASTTLSDATGQVRIESTTLAGPGLSPITGADGDARTTHYDANWKKRIRSGTNADGKADTTHLDVNGKVRISSATLADGHAGTTWSEYDANGKMQIVKVLP